MFTGVPGRWNQSSVLEIAFLTEVIWKILVFVGCSGSCFIIKRMIPFSHDRRTHSKEDPDE